MIFDKVAATIGGVVKDIQKAAIATGEFLVDEVSSIPAAFSAGYDHGLMSSSDPIDPPVIEEQPAQRPFGTVA